MMVEEGEEEEKPAELENENCKTEFGACVQTHDDADMQNNMKERTTDAICMGPVRNDQGTHLFCNLNTKCLLTRGKWTEIPMPQSAVENSTAQGKAEKGAARGLDFHNRHGEEPEFNDLDDSNITGVCDESWKNQETEEDDLEDNENEEDD